MRTLGARLGRVAPGEGEVELPYRADLTQQQDIVYGAIATAIVGNACSLSIIVPDTAVLALTSWPPVQGRLVAGAVR